MVPCNCTAFLDASLDAAFLLDADGLVLYKNLAARRLFDSPEVNDDARANVSSFFVCANGGGDDDGLSSSSSWWSEVVAGLPNAAADGESEGVAASKSASAPSEQRDATGYMRDGSKFDATVSLARIGLCGCCAEHRHAEVPKSSDLPPPSSSSSAPSTTAVVICAYLRENSTRQQNYIRNLEKEIRRLQNTQLAVEGSFDPYFSINPAGTILSVNQAATRVFGWSRDEFLGRDIKMICGGDHAARHSQYLKNYMTTGEKRVMGRKRELPARKKDGTEFTIELGLVEVKSQFSNRSNDVTFCGFIKDLSGIKAFETELKLKKELTSAMIESSFDAMFQIDEEGIIHMVNNAAIEVFGWTRNEFLGQNISMIAGDEHGRNHDKYLQRYLETGEAKAMGKMRELKARKKDGTQFSIELGLSEVRLPDGKRMFCGYVRDLTKQKLQMQKLQAMIESNTFDPMFEINEKGVIQMVNGAATTVFGWTREEFVGSNISMITGGDHAEKHDKYIARYLATGEKRVMGKKRELPARKKDGTEFKIELGLTEVITANGHKVFCGYVRDLTQQKRDEERIQRKQELTDGMIDSSFDPMFQINERGIIQMVNQAAVDHFGWSKEEFLGNNVRMITGREHQKKHDEYLARFLKTGEKKAMGKRRQVNAMRKDGTEFPIELGLTEVKTVWGGERLFCGFVRDVRREKFDEQELREQAKLTTAIVEKSTSALLTIDEHGSIRSANGTAVELFGFSKDEFLGAVLSKVLGSEFTEKNASDLPRFIKSSKDKEREVEGRRRDGVLCPLYMRLIEVEGPFPIMLGMTQREGPKGTRLFAAFFRGMDDEKAAPAQNNNIFGWVNSFGHLQSEEGDTGKRKGQ